MNTPCHECGAYHGHSYTCSHLTLEQAKEYLLDCSRGLKRSHESWLHLRREVTFWQGKFHMVRHENNKLRKNNRRLTELPERRDKALGLPKEE